MPKNALGTIIAPGVVSTSTPRILLTISPRFISLVISIRLLSSSVTPSAFRLSTIRFPCASASSQLSPSTWPTAVAQTLPKCLALSTSRGAAPSAPAGTYSTSETDFIRSATAITLPLTQISAG